MKSYDKIIIGAGIYGLYSALRCGKKKERVLVLEADSGAFKRATYINQARVHNGYHYPRSISTASKSAKYFEKFAKDYSFSINGQFDKIYATSGKFSWSDASQFEKFCHAAGIPCEKVDPDKFFKKNMCDGAFLTREYTYDAAVLKNYFLKEIAELSNIEILYGVVLDRAERLSEDYVLYLNDGEKYKAPFVLNASYASVNQLITLFHETGLFKIKYELCEIIIVSPSDMLRRFGLTVMDGPFFSVMPFGLTGDHSLTSVTFTPHSASFETLPSFPCQDKSEGFCSPLRLGNCNYCRCKPASAFGYMSTLAKKYLIDDLDFKYKYSLFSMKPILKSSEIDDSRPTVIRRHSEKPCFISVLSGKINTVYDLDEVL